MGNRQTKPDRWNRRKIKQLLKVGENVDQVKRHETPLMWCAMTNTVELAEELMLCKADPNWTNISGMTPLMLACTYGYLELVKEMLKFGANPDIQNDVLETALMIATIEGYPDIVEILLKHDADPNIQDYDGCTALHYVLDMRSPSNSQPKLFNQTTRENQKKIAKLLVQHGADREIENIQGLTAYDLSMGI